ncbi:MAG: WbqC family protein [Nanoarchaeota archaeon]
MMGAHQPNFLPYLGFFAKMRDSDIFVIRDEVLFVERDYHHRNRIRIAGVDCDGNPQWKWLTIPVEKRDAYLGEICIKTGSRVKNIPWNIHMLRQIRSSYETAPYFADHFPRLEEILSSGDELLIDLNMRIIAFLRDAFGLSTEVVRASALSGYEKSGDASTDLARISQATKAAVYLSGGGGRNYLNLIPFTQAGIEVAFQEFHHPTYAQCYLGFVPNLASIDALFNAGPGILAFSEGINAVRQEGG